VDAIADHTGRVVIGGIMEHIEQAGTLATRLHLHLVTVGSFKQDSDLDGAAGEGAEVIGLMNIQFAVVGTQGYDPQVYILKPTRASRTVPFLRQPVCHWRNWRP